MRTVYRSEDFSARERLDAWQNVNDRSIMPLAISGADPADFTATVRQAQIGAAALSQLVFSPHQVARTPALVQRFDPELYTLALTLRGSIGLDQAGRDTVSRAGDLMLYDSSLPFCSRVGDGPGDLTETLLLHIPKHLMPLPADSVERLLAVRLPADQGLAAVVAQTLTSIHAEAAHCTPADTARLGTVVIDLLTALVSHHLDDLRPLPPGPRQSALLLTIETFIERHLADPSLTPGSVAAAHHISVRYLHRLFEHRETTVAALIRRRRLDRCRSDLADPALAHLPIHAIATRWGFPHPADFSRAFRTAFAVSPRAYRRDASS
ncbi:helix-turn-helix domain-containing protein [Streptomyces sp.]|uniref:AraC-like ligand-binding domain-containing protein n=1 Tax=Streptomyces sp. TaxID=1931 RepID=UPI002F3E6015